VMSQERHRARTSAGPSEGVSAATPRLLSRVRGDERDDTPASVLDSITDDLEADPDFDEQLVTQSLDELLLALIALRSDGTHGTALIEDVGDLFDVEPSPGTVYPRLHDLDAEGTLARHDLVQTKQYAISDDEAAGETLEAAAHQHLAMGLFLTAALESV